jgi:hypothetical protein
MKVLIVPVTCALLAACVAGRSAAEYLATQGVEIAVDERREHLTPNQYLLHVPSEVISGDPTSGHYKPSSDFHWYRRSSADATAASGDWLEQTVVVAKTALFDNRSDRLLWTAKSATMDDQRFKRTSESIVRTVARQLFAKDLIARMAEPAALQS